ncbi:hypothetical protein L1887_29381 [Cichorium endivia]|nr:hypothetical protein L1887_29381 [Cichorium endivia]
MEEEPHKVEVAESKPKKAKSVKITRVRKPSERIMKKTSFRKFTNVESDPIILDFDSDYSSPRFASPHPQNPNITDPTQSRTKYKNESRGTSFVEHKSRMITEESELPEKRSIIDDTTNKDVPPKLRRAP